MNDGRGSTTLDGKRGANERRGIIRSRQRQQRDNLTSLETISDFANKYGATLTVMESGEHWFHTEEQMRFLDAWIRSEPFDARME